MDERTDVPDSYNPLAALGQKLAMRGLTIDHMLHVADATGVSLSLFHPDHAGHGVVAVSVFGS